MESLFKLLFTILLILPKVFQSLRLFKELADGSQPFQLNLVSSKATGVGEIVTNICQNVSQCSFIQAVLITMTSLCYTQLSFRVVVHKFLCA